MKYSLIILALTSLAYAEFEGDVDFRQLKIRQPKRKLDGKIEINERIVGGSVVPANSIPYQAALIVTAQTGTYLCGGALISPTNVLTAAHCLAGASQVQVRLGAHFWNINEATQQRFITTNFIVHAGYDDELVINDLAMITLPTAAILNDYVQLATLPSYSDIGYSFVGYWGRVSGWGVISDATQQGSENLRSVETEIITNLACNISFLGGIVATHICTSGFEGLGACSGDGGGPLVIGNKLVGIVSFALELGCEAGWPTVYSRLTTFLDWIADHSDANIYP
ncbi:brachyurin-like [Onthophagus taurus]|uniref:brachyurin-like n=1 Tax=Onthophagus taurus TaxID=166361 RepID=UPI0039BEC9D1